MPANGKALIDRYDKLVQAASTHRTRWEAMAPYLSLSRVGITTKFEPGQKLNPYVWDSTSLMASELMAQFVASNTISPAQQWFSLRMRNLNLRGNDAINEWLEESRDRMLAQFSRSMFYGEGVESLIDWGGFGTGFLLVEELPPSINRRTEGFRGFHVQAKRTGRFVIADGPDGLVDTAMDEMEMTASNLKAQFGDTKLPEKVTQALATGKPDEKFCVVHAIYPRTLSEQEFAAGNLKMPWASVWIEKESKTILRESGYPSFPAGVPRYHRTPGEVYGRGRGDIAFGDIWTLNQAKKMGLEDWALKIRPPVLMRHDSVIGTLRLVPSGPTTINTHGQAIGDTIMPWQTGSHPEVSQIKEEELRKSIRQIFFVDQILALMEVSKSEMTAFEFAKKMELLFKLMGPVYGRTQRELLQRVVDIAFEQMWLAGAFSPPPDNIFDTDGEIAVEFENPLARAQRAVDVESVTLAIQDLIPIAQVKPEVWDWLDTDKYAQHAFSVRGVPAKVTRTDQEVEALRQARFQQEAQEQSLAEAGQIAEAGGKVAPLLTALQGGRPR